jgi:hypothetical protein
MLCRAKARGTFYLSGKSATIGPLKVEDSWLIGRTLQRWGGVVPPGCCLAQWHLSLVDIGGLAVLRPRPSLHPLPFAIGLLGVMRY